MDQIGYHLRAKQNKKQQKQTETYAIEAKNPADAIAIEPANDLFLL